MPSDLVGIPPIAKITVPVGTAPEVVTVADKLTVAVELPSAIDAGVAVNVVFVGAVTVRGHALLVEAR